MTLFASLEGKEGEVFGKKEGASGRNRRHWEERALGVVFLDNTKPSSSGGTKNCIGGGFWGFLKDLYKFFIFNICCYNIKNT